MRRAPHATRLGLTPAAVIAAALFLACDGGPAPTEPPVVPPEPEPPAAPPPLDSVAIGHAAFLRECASCHPPRDGYDLALFGFGDADIVRRGVAHVTRDTAHHIAAYIRSLGVEPIGRQARPFQPGTRLLWTDGAFWSEVFGTEGWPEGVTAEAIAAIDLRATNAPVPLPRWSVEADESDWMPETPLAPELLEASGGQLEEALEAYHAAPGTGALLHVIERFQAVSLAGYGSVCQGHTGAHARPRDCFEARRWLSALAGLHFLRAGQQEDIPIEVVDLWWETGEAAVSLYFRERVHSRSIVTGWLYLGYSYAPTRFNENNGYLGQFLQSSDMPRLAAFTALRRMVDQGPVHEGFPFQPFWDALLATSRAPNELKAPILVFSYAFLLDWLERNTLDTAAAGEAARMTRQAFDFAQERLGETTRLAEAAELRDRILAQLEGG